MKTYIFLQGGLGNQMFQYAFYLMIKQINPKTICDFSLIKNGLDHNGFELEKVFNLKSIPLKHHIFSLKFAPTYHFTNAKSYYQTSGLL